LRPERRFRMVSWICVVFATLHSPPAPQVQQSANLPAGRLPRGVEDWDYLGTFELRDENARVYAVKLYAWDTDSVADKKRDGDGRLFGGRMYPNCFELHAMYRAGSGDWLHKELYRVARVGFSQVLKRASERVLLELESKFIVFSGPGETHSEDEVNRMLEVHRPHTMSLRIVDGCPVLKEE
jgi:hypothetical protein